MAFSRGDIIEVYFKLPDAQKEVPHPAIIISNDNVALDDDCYICVMITSSTVIDIYSFQIEDKMLNKSMQKKGQARVHLLANILSSQITNRKIFATMKPAYVDKLCSKIQDIVFSNT